MLSEFQAKLKFFERVAQIFEKAGLLHRRRFGKRLSGARQKKKVEERRKTTETSRLKKLPKAADGKRRTKQDERKRKERGEMNAEEKLAELNLTLPQAAKPMGVYVPVVQVGELLFLSGHGPLRSDGSLVTGKVGADISEAEGKQAARLAGLAVLATLKAHLGTLERVERLVKVTVWVNSSPDFVRQPQVANGFSELMVEVFGEEAGRAARSAVGAVSLPAGMAVEVEAVVKVKAQPA